METTTRTRIVRAGTDSTVRRAGDMPTTSVPLRMAQRWHGMEPVDEELSELLDERGDLLPLLTFGEARALLFVAHLLGSGDAAASDAARDMETRLERRLKVMFPGQDILLKSVSYDW
ncbi:hypothetical protein [Streptomyces sp. NPDC001315]|uniref:hypothetical protein n=1 Tax=Streptomyces sp. NPDC001315 TaxID=3364562 RepID=UPI0036BB360C